MDGAPTCHRVATQGYNRGSTPAPTTTSNEISDSVTDLSLHVPLQNIPY